MQIAIVGAGFAPAEADRLRRAMATFRRMGTIGGFREKFVAGMIANGYAHDYAERCFRQIEGFGDYGFPESHAASFALLVYVSAWLKCRYPAAFACALLNSQPMGFYAPAQIVRDARDHGVAVLPVDVNRSEFDCTLEPPGDGAAGATGAAGAAGTPAPALRLGLREIKGFARADADALTEARAAAGGFDDVHALWSASGLDAPVLERLAYADAFASLGLDRRRALWAVRRLKERPLPLFAAAEARAAAGPAGPAGPVEHGEEPALALPPMALGEEVVEDYAATRLSLKRHPLALLRPALLDARHVEAGRLAAVAAGTRVRVAGLVIGRQRPGTASGVIFMTLEDETGVANVVVWPRMLERYRKAVLRSRLLSVAGKVEREGLVVHVIAARLVDMTARLADLGRRGVALSGFDTRFARPLAAPVAAAAEAHRIFPSRDFH